jgi:hypothetical protein
LGGLKWSPDVFYRAEFDDTIDAIVGHKDEFIEFERVMRRHALIAVSPWLDKKFDIFTHWPITKDEEIQSSVKKDQKARRLARLRQLKTIEAQKKYGNTT